MPRACLASLMLAVGFAASAWTTTQTSRTIPEIVASGGSPGLGGPVPSGPGPDIAWLLSRTDTIVTGVVGPPAPSYLSETQQDVYTDYPIQSSKILYQSFSEPVRMPGILPRVTVTVHGGTIRINGMPFDAKYPDEPQLKPGTQYLFLLKRAGDKYRLADDYYGVFAVTRERITPLLESQRLSRYKTLTAQAAMDEIVSLAHSFPNQRK